MQKFNLSIISPDAELAKKLQNFICGKRSEIIRKNLSFSSKECPLYTSCVQAATYLLKNLQPMYLVFAVRESNFYSDLKQIIPFLPFCKQEFIVLIGCDKPLLKKCADRMKFFLKTPVISTDLKHGRRALKKSIFSLLEQNAQSGYKEVYLEKIADFSKNLAIALSKSNEVFMPLAPYIISFEKSEIEKLCKAVGCDILDNLQVLKELCFALEQLKVRGEEKKKLLQCVKHKENELAKSVSTSFYINSSNS